MSRSKPVKKPVKKDAKQLAADALDRMHVEELTPTPENYELWYVYHAGTNPDVTHAIDMLISNKEKITDEACQGLHQRFLGDTGVESEAIRQTGEKIQQTIDEITNTVHEVQEATTEYNESLGGVADSLDEDMSKADMAKLLKKVSADTQKVLEQNKVLENKLGATSSTIAGLQQDLEKAQKEALTDSLTRLANRKAFDERMVQMLKHAVEDGASFTLLLLDIDHFKKFNDSYGHQIGDQVLRRVGRTLVDSVKGRDMVARYGGEEFAVILPQTGIQAGLRVGESLRNAVASKEIKNRQTGKKLGRITLSAGVAEYHAGEVIEDIIDRADTALYMAKRNGRNQVVAAAPPPPGANDTDKKAAI